MQIIFEADLNKMTEELQELSPERFLRILAVAVKNMAKRNAHEAGKGGKSFWQREILPSIREEVSPDYFSVYSDSYIAAHVHHGGEIKPKKSQFLAIPIDHSVKGKFAKDIPDLFVWRKKEEGPNGRAYLARQLKTKIKPLFVLKRSVFQKARPWFPDEKQFRREIVTFLEKNF